MVHADPADFDDVATFYTMRLFERAENPERYWFPLEKLPDRNDCGTQDEVYKQVVRDYATDKLFLSAEKAEQFRLQFYYFHNYYFDIDRERCSYNLVRFMAIVRQIWETKAVEALGDALDHFRDKINPAAPFDICADAAEFVVQHVELAAAVQPITMYPDNFAAQCNLELIATVCLQCAVAAALNEESGNYLRGFNPPSCVSTESVVKLFSGPPTPEYETGKCDTCLHAKTVHYNSVPVLGCGSCHACLKHSAELWDLVDEVARLEIPSPVKYPSHAYGLAYPPPGNITWTAMPLLNRKMSLALALGPVGSALYPRLCDELLSVIHCALPPQATAEGTLTMNSNPYIPYILHDEVDDSSTIDAPVPRLFIDLLQNGFFANAFHMIQSKNLDLKKSDAKPELYDGLRWLNFKRLNFSREGTPFTSVDLVPSVSNIMISNINLAYDQFLIRSGQSRIYSVDKRVSTRFLTEILKFVEFTEQTTGASHLALVTPEVDLSLASTNFSTIQGAEALSIIQFQKGDKLGEGKFGKVYEVTCGTMRLALKVIDLNQCSIPRFETYFSSWTVSSWIDVCDNKMHMLMPRYTTNLYDYIETKKGLTSGGNDMCKIAAFRVIVAWVALRLLTELAILHLGERKIYHGDIHTGNVFLLLDEDGAIADVVLGDFGLAHSEKTAPTETTTTDESCPNPSGPLIFSGFSSTGEGNDLANLRSNVIRYILKDIKKHLSVEELRLCGWQTRGPAIVFTAEEMRKAADEALQRTLSELCLINVFLPQENTQVLEENLPHHVRPAFEGCKKDFIEEFPPNMLTQSTKDQVKACLEAVTKKQDDLDCLLESVYEVFDSQPNLSAAQQQAVESTIWMDTLQPFGSIVQVKKNPSLNQRRNFWNRLSTKLAAVFGYKWQD